MRVRNSVGILAVEVALQSGCLDYRDPHDQGMVGVATVSVTQAPLDVTCLRVTVDGARTIERRFELIPGQSSVFTLRGLPIGVDTFTGFAYAEACGSVDDTSVPTWLSEPVSVTLSTGVVGDVRLVMRRNGRADVAVDFEDDSVGGGGGGGGSETCSAGQKRCVGAVEETCDTSGQWQPRSDNVFACAAQIGVGANFSCARMQDGTVQCWGANTGGQLGDGTTTSRSIPAPVQGLTGVVEIAVGNLHTCALLEDGTVQCWGSNDAGQLGIDDIDVNYMSPTPTVINGLTGVVQVGAGSSNSCALLQDTTVRCWGTFQTGRRVIAPTPVLQPNGDLLAGVRGIAIGAGDSCAIMFDGTVGTVRCWGNVLVDGGSYPEPNPFPVLVPTLSGVVEVGCGVEHDCALEAGAVRCWGRSYFGALGDGSSNVSGVPVTVSGLSGFTGPSGVVDISVGYDHSCAVLRDATVRCWGFNYPGIFLDGTYDNSHVPVTAVGLTNVARVEIAYDHACVLLRDGTVQCWGVNGEGALGDGTTNTTFPPVPVQVVRY